MITRSSTRTATKWQGKETVNGRPAGTVTSGFFPDYYIEIEQIFSKGDLAVVYGYAGAGTGEKAWKIPAAWRAIMRDGKIELWQVYADTKIQFEKNGNVSVEDSYTFMISASLCLR